VYVQNANLSITKYTGINYYDYAIIQFKILMKFYDAVYAYAIISRNISRKISSRIRKKNAVPQLIEGFDKIMKSLKIIL